MRVCDRISRAQSKSKNETARSLQYRAPQEKHFSLSICTTIITKTKVNYKVPTENLYLGLQAGSKGTGHKMHAHYGDKNL